jgi:hypothetical protein
MLVLEFSKKSSQANKSIRIYTDLYEFTRIHLVLAESADVSAIAPTVSKELD